jgi:hypothetical protein
MFIYKSLTVILFTFSAITCVKGWGSDDAHTGHSILNVKDTLNENLNLYNGRLWVNTYYKIKGDPFFLSAEFLSGSVTFNGKEYPAQKLKYDIFNDEIILWVNPVTIIVLNKEMVDSVTLNYQNKTYKVVNQGDDSTNVVKGLVNVYYEGSTTLFVKNKKVIDLLAVDKRYDLFYQIHKIYVKKDDKIFLVSGKKDLLRILEDKALEIKSFIKASRLAILRKDPESFIPVLRYYDSLKQ